MTVSELKKLLETVPDELVVVSRNDGGYPDDEFVEPAVQTAEEGFGRYLAGRDPKRTYLFF